MAEQDNIRTNDLWDTITRSPQGRIVIGLLIGIGLLIAGFYNINKVSRLEKAGVKTDATVLSVRHVQKRKGGRKSYATIKFTDEKGTSHEVELGHVSSVQENQKIKVIYLPSSPKTVVIDSPAATSRVPGYILMGMSGFGWLVVLYNVIALMIYNKRTA